MKRQQDYQLVLAAQRVAYTAYLLACKSMAAVWYVSAAEGQLARPPTCLGRSICRHPRPWCKAAGSPLQRLDDFRGQNNGQQATVTFVRTRCGTKARAVDQSTGEVRLACTLNVTVHEFY